MFRDCFKWKVNICVWNVGLGIYRQEKRSFKSNNQMKLDCYNIHINLNHCMEFPVSRSGFKVIMLQCPAKDWAECCEGVCVRSAGACRWMWPMCSQSRNDSLTLQPSETFCLCPGCWNTHHNFFLLLFLLHRTNSDSALHTSAMNPNPQDPFGMHQQMGRGPPQRNGESIIRTLIQRALSMRPFWQCLVL